jgi:thiamine pyrophosphate-dependent acetolactate synthase large subunit-like protein
MKRYDCLKIIRPYVRDEDLVITSLGGLMDEWYNLRPSDRNLPLHNLGVITPLALGLAIALPRRRIVCLDTDGSVFLNLGMLCTLGNQRPRNLRVFVMDNACYECIGGYPTPSGGRSDIAAMARGAGVDNAVSVSSPEQLEEEARKAFGADALSYVVCRVEPGTERFPVEKRIPWDGFELKYHFIREVERLEGITIKPPEHHYDFQADQKNKAGKAPK